MAVLVFDTKKDDAITTQNKNQGGIK